MTCRIVAKKWTTSTDLFTFYVKSVPSLGEEQPGIEKDGGNRRVSVVIFIETLLEAGRGSIFIDNLLALGCLGEITPIGYSVIHRCGTAVHAHTTACIPLPHAASLIKCSVHACYHAWPQRG